MDIQKLISDLMHGGKRRWTALLIIAAAVIFGVISLAGPGKTVDTDSSAPALTVITEADSPAETSRTETQTTEKAAETTKKTKAEKTTTAATTTTTTTAAPEETAETAEYVEYHFKNQDLLDQHYEKHGRDMGFSDAEEYEGAASDVVNDPTALHKTEKEDGDDVYYVESTNEFVVVSRAGYIRTYFYPDKGKAYYDKQ